jgi:hypothetical protein
MHTAVAEALKEQRTQGVGWGIGVGVHEAFVQWTRAEDGALDCIEVRVDPSRIAIVGALQAMGFEASMHPDLAAIGIMVLDDLSLVTGASDGDVAAKVTEFLEMFGADSDGSFEVFP